MAAVLIFFSAKSGGPHIRFPKQTAQLTDNELTIEFCQKRKASGCCGTVGLFNMISMQNIAWHLTSNVA